MGIPVAVATAFDISAPVLLQGVIVGLPYGLLAVGLVLIYKVSRFVNFAQGAIGAFGGALVGTLVVSYGVPYWIAFVFGIATAAGVAAAIEATIVRRLEGQPRLLGVAVTLLLAQFLLALSFTVNSDAQLGSLFPQPSGFPQVTIAGLVVSPPALALVVLSPLVVVGLALLLRRTSLGMGIRATSSNPDAAFALGVSPARVAGRTWGVAGAISAFAVILLWPTQGFGALVVLGPSLMLRGLVAASIARFDNVGAAFLTGIGIGVLDTVVRTADATSGAVDVVLTIIALVVLLARPPKVGRLSDSDGDWTALALPRPPLPLRRFWLVRHIGTVLGSLAFLGAALWLPRYLDSSAAFAASTTIAFAIVGLSVLLLTGRAGQLSLGQWAIAGVGAMVSAKVVTATGAFVLGPVAAMAVGAVVAVVLGLPALRARGLVVAIVTLAFALATRSWLLPQPWAMGDGLEVAQPVIGPYRLDDSKLYYFLALAMLAVAIVLTRMLAGSRFGRDLVAIRDNEGAARALGVPVVARKLQVFAAAGAIAGLGGSVFAHAQQLVTAEQFPAADSVNAVVLAVVGGLAVTTGPVIGALLAVGVPQATGMGAAAFAGLQFVFLLIVVARPGGVVRILVPVRDWLIEEFVRLRGVDPRALDAQEAARPGTPFDNHEQLPARSAPPRDGATGVPALELRRLSRSYGGIRAVSEVSLTVPAGESVALIGPNGAGKTTLFEMAAGFVRPHDGRVLLEGRDITRLSPQRRARLGLVRSFQNAALFPTMTVEDSLHVAARGRRAAWPVPVVLDAMGLAPFAESPLSTLPTGVRRMTELACDLMLAPRVLLLDEPSAGVAHHEIASLATLLRRVHRDLGVTLVVIDHDMTLLRAVCDRFVALELGRVIATGTADEVQRDPAVVEAFLGSTEQVAERSGPLAAAPSSR